MCGRRVRGSARTRWLADEVGSDRDNRDEVVESGQVFGVAGVDGGVVSVRGGGDQQVHDAGSGLTSDLRDAGGEAPVAVSDGVVNGKRVEPSLDGAQSGEPAGPHLRGLGDQDTEVQFGDAGHADSQLPGDRGDVAGDQNAGVENAAAHRVAQGSTREPSSRSRSAAQSASAGSAKTSARSSQLRHARGLTGPSTAAGRPATVIVTRSPASARRTRSLAFWRISRSPTSLMNQTVAPVLPRRRESSGKGGGRPPTQRAQGR